MPTLAVKIAAASIFTSSQLLTFFVQFWKDAQGQLYSTTSQASQLTAAGSSIQVYEVASDAGAEDILPALDEDEHLEGFKVSICLHLCS